MTTVRLFELRQQHLVLLLVLAAVAVAAVFICWRGLTVRAWRVESPKLRAPLRLAVVADLHSSRFGRHQSRLLEAIDRLAPQLVLFAGDTVDDARPEGPAFELLEALGPRYPCLLVCGNHEYRTGQLPELKRRFAALGVTVLAGQRVDLPDSGPVVSGLDDPEGLDEDYARQLDQVGQTLDRSRFNILLAHRPEYFESYIPYGYDLVLCGHTHGGQWRLGGRGLRHRAGPVSDLRRRPVRKGRLPHDHQPGAFKEAPVAAPHLQPARTDGGAAGAPAGPAGLSPSSAHDGHFCAGRSGGA